MRISSRVDPLPPVVSNGAGRVTAWAVLVVDDQAAVRDGLARLLASAPLRLSPIATAASGDDALRLARELAPDIVLLDADLAGVDGLALIPAFGPDAAVLVLTSHGDAATRERAARLGARAFVEKHEPAARLLQQIAAVAGPRPRGEEAPIAAGTTAAPDAVASSAAQWSRPA